MAKQKLRVAVIGAGGIFRGAHLPGWQKLADVEVVAVADIHRPTAEATAEAAGVPKERVFEDFTEMLRKVEVDIVDVCTPNKAHTPATVASLKAGAHVICEKPLAATPAEVNKMIQARDKAGKLLMTAQHKRFTPSARALKSYIEGGALGDLYYARAWAIRRRGVPGRDTFIVHDLSGGGPCLDIGVHCLDLTMHLMGCPKPVTVTGVAPMAMAGLSDVTGPWGPWDKQKYDVEDFAAGFVRFENGASLSLECSWLLNMKEREIFSAHLFGTKAGVQFPAAEFYTEKDGTLIDGQLVHMPQESGYENEIAAFHEAIVKGLPSPVPAEESLDVIKILDGIYRSHKSGREIKLA